MSSGTGEEEGARLERVSALRITSQGARNDYLRGMSKGSECQSHARLNALSSVKPPFAIGKCSYTLFLALPKRFSCGTGLSHYCWVLRLSVVHDP